MEEIREFPFVGRVAETAHFVRLLGKTPATSESLSILITGERGIGKTRFIEEMAPRAQASGFRVLLHRCQKWDHYQPFATISALLRLMMGKPSGWTPRSLETLTKALYEKFQQLSFAMPEVELLYWLLGASDVSERTANLDERSRKGLITTLFGMMFKQQIRQQPFLLIALDDIHHSDSLSASYLLNVDLGKGTALMISAHTAASLELLRKVEEVRLSPIGEERIEQLLHGLFGMTFPAEQFAPELFKITGGNPLHLTQLLGQLPVDNVSAAGLSEILRQKRPREAFEAAVDRLRLLNARSLAVIKSASLIADQFPLPILKRMVGARFPLKAALRNLRHQNLARVQSRSGRHVFLFQHGMVKEAAYSLIDEHEKEVLHAVAASALTRYYSRRAEEHLMSIAHHYEEAGDRENAADTYYQAGYYFFKVGDFPSAEEAYRAAERLFEDKEKKLDAVAGLITVLDTEGKTEECLRKAREFFKMIPSDRLRAKVLCTLARRYSMSGNLDKATECAKNAIEAGERCGEKSEIAKACAYLAGTLARMGHIREALTYGGRGYDIAEELGSERLLGLTLNALALVTAMDGNLQEAKRLFEETAQADEKTGYLHSAALARLNVAAAMSEMGECEEALERYREAIGLFEKMGALQSAAAAKYNAAATLIDLGEYRSGFSMLQDALSLFRKTKSTSGMGRSFVLMASFLLKMGRIDEALSVLEKGWRILMEEGHRAYKAFVLETRIECAILSGKIQKALDESKAFLEEAMQGEMTETYRSALLLRLRVLLEANRLSEAEDISKRIVKAGIPEQNPGAEALCKVRLAHLAAKKEDIEKAEDLFHEALSTGHLSKEICAESHLGLGKALLKAGKLPQARRFLEKAKEEYTTLVAAGYRKHELERVEKLLTGIPL